ncbi:hypothetical protein Ocin01_13102 [Orchesella cincta]|uniref:Uncharacterized protein n=1 Tax=Orchesella cincta TaxID=48709 RepID=A0A1D2MKY3_ORCCI|nr:hypothetical protein Ocin01_13102 [Orchesella cincta]
MKSYTQKALTQSAAWILKALTVIPNQQVALEIYYAKFTRVRVFGRLRVPDDHILEQPEMSLWGRFTRLLETLRNPQF